jgi:hypothetical protein
MLTKIFSTNTVFTIAIFIVMTLVLWLKVFTNEAAIAAPMLVSPLYHMLFKLLGNLNIISGLIAIALLFYQALLINYVLVENDLVPRKSYMAAFILVIFLSLFNEIIMLNPVLIAGLFIISAVRLIFRLYEEHEAYKTVLNIGTLISVASLFYFPSIVFIMIIWAAFIIYRLFSWREWFISLLGFILPYLFLSTYYFLNDCLMLKILEYKRAFAFLNLNYYSTSIFTFIVLIFLGLLIVVSIIKLLITINERQIRIRKFISMLIWLMIISFASLSLSSNYRIAGFLTILLPASVLFSIFISILRRSVVGEIAIITLILLMITIRLDLWSLF